MATTVTRLFDNYSDAAEAVRKLEALGIPHDDLSLIANNAEGNHDHAHAGTNDDGDVSRGASTGAAIGGVGGLLAGLGLLAIPGLGPIVAAGWLAATAAGAGIGAIGGGVTGGIVGALKNAGHTEEDAHVYSEGVRRGGTLLSARVPNDRVTEAESIMQSSGGVDASVRGRAYRDTGWKSFDETAPAYDRDQIARERQLYSRETTRL